MKGAWVWSLVREPRSCMPCGPAKKEKKKKKEDIHPRKCIPAPISLSGNTTGSTSYINFKVGTNYTLKKGWKLWEQAQVWENPKTQMVKKRVLLKRHIWRGKKSKMAWFESIPIPTRSSPWKDEFEGILTLESDNNSGDQRVPLKLSPSVQVGWTFCKPTGYFTRLGVFLLSFVGTKLALKARQAGRCTSVSVFSSQLAEISENASFPISRPSTP